MPSEPTSVVQSLLDVDARVYDALRVVMAAPDDVDAFDDLAGAVLDLLKAEDRLHGRLPTAPDWLKDTERQRLERVTTAMLGVVTHPDPSEFLEWVLAVYRQDVMSTGAPLMRQRPRGERTGFQPFPRYRG